MKNNPPIRLIALTMFALIAFAGNSVLCRLALKDELIDANSFTIIRLASGAVTLIVLLLLTSGLSALKNMSFKAHTYKQSGYLFIYAAFFSFAYILLDTASGALLLFTSVQFTMLAVQIFKGSRPTPQELVGLLLAIFGFIYWMLPNSESPSLAGAILMVVSGIAWAGYTLSGKQSKNAKLDTTKNFTLCLLYIFSLLPIYGLFISLNISLEGALYAALSGCLTSALGYWVWYSVLPSLTVNSAAVLQLLVPIIAAIGGLIWTSESITYSFLVASGLILSGIYLVVKKPSLKTTE